MKKIISSVLCAILVFTMIPFVLAAEEGVVTVTPSSANIMNGDTIEFVVRLDNVANAKSASIAVSFPENFEFVSANWLLPSGFMSDFDTATNKGIHAYLNETSMNGNYFKLTLKSVKANISPADISFEVTIKSGNITVFDGIAVSKVKVSDQPFSDDMVLLDKSFEYDSTTKSLAIENLPNGAKVEFENNEAENVGIYSVTATVSKDGYETKKLTATMTITPKALTATGISSANKEYDGTTTAIISGGTLNGVIAGDDVTVDFPTEGVFAKKDVGTEIVVSYDPLVLEGADKDNYTLTQPGTLKANITARKITVSADNKEMVKGENLPELTYTITSGTLVDGDELAGALATTATGSKLGSFDINKGTLSASSNYNLTFVKGTLKVIEKELQDVTVSEIPQKTYGDTAFALSVTDNSTEFGTIKYSSSDENIAVVDENGNVTIKNAGSAIITLSRNGNDRYADLNKKITVVVNKRPITITAKSYTIKQGNNVPELEYEITEGSLVGEDVITGSLATSANGTKLGKFDITKGTISAGDNYNITFVKGTLEVVEKNPQDVTIATVPAKTYGDESFALEITDNNTEFGAFSFASNNNNIVTVSAEGTVSIVGAGTAQITISRNGNNDYSSFEKKIAVTVSKRPITITAKSYTIRQNTSIPSLEYTITEGSLANGDVITGELQTSANIAKVGKYTINQGTLAINDNYVITFKKGELEVVEKNPQDVTVASVSAKTYGDENFALEITDNNTELGTLSFASNNENVVTVSEDGTVTIIGAGSAKITVSRNGNDDYANLSKTINVTINKKLITITAKSHTIKQGNNVPELEYEITEGSLVDGDAITGALATSANGTKLGNFDIKIGTITAGTNYNITFVKGILEVIPKTAQNIVVATLPAATYGDAEITLNVTKDDAANLDTYTFESSNTDVAEISDLGIITIKTAGTTDITVKQAGNEEYAPFEHTQTLTVNKKEISLSALNLDEKTVTLEGVLDTDTSVAIDFSALNVVVPEEFEGENVQVQVSNIVLSGEASGNYVLSTESFETTVAIENLAQITAIAENGSVEGEGYYYKGTLATVKATANSGYRFAGWYVDGNKVSSDSEYTFAISEDIELTAMFSKKSTQSITTAPAGSTVKEEKYTVKFESNGGTAVPSQTVKEGKRITRPADPIKEGYTFGGWYYNNMFTAEYEFLYAVSGNMTLYAKWNAIEKPAKTYTDVSDNDWFAEAVKFAYQKGLMNGVSETEFAPAGTVTRGMMVTVLYRIAGEPECSAVSSFSDVVNGAYYEKAISWAKENGIVNGYSETNFAPDAFVTREQLATIIYRYATSKGYDVSVGYNTNILSYDDFASISEYAISAIQYAVGSGLMNGKTAATINPTDNFTRAELATILQRFSNI